VLELERRTLDFDLHYTATHLLLSRTMPLIDAPRSVRLGNPLCLENSAEYAECLDGGCVLAQNLQKKPGRIEVRVLIPR
jgi:hypothetical protein